MESRKKAILVWTVGALSLALLGGYVYARQAPFLGPPPVKEPPPDTEEDGSAAQSLPRPQVSIEESDGYRTITSNGIPNHSTGQFLATTNPNRIQPQKYKFRMPLKPVLGQVVPLNHDVFGVALNGIPFDPSTNKFWNHNRAWNYEALTGKVYPGTDSGNAHVQPGGIYQYHGLPNKLIEKLGKKNQMVLIGYGSDGVPIYATYSYEAAGDSKSALKALRSSYRLKKGVRPTGKSGPGGNYDGTFTADWEYVADSGDLDECNGRTGVTPEYPQGTYYYVLTNEFPFVPRYHHAKPDTYFLMMKPRPNVTEASDSQGRLPGGSPAAAPPPPPPPPTPPPPPPPRWRF